MWGCSNNVISHPLTRFRQVKPYSHLNPIPTYCPSAQVLCERCAELCNGAMIPAVQDFTQKLAMKETLKLAAEREQSTDADGELEAELQVELLGKALISPEQLRAQLKEVRDKKAVVVMLIDLLDASGSLMTKVIQIQIPRPLNLFNNSSLMIVATPGP